ncbi:MAG: UvrD-helicase domain-containing protein [Flavobacteriales bacterium]
MGEKFEKRGFHIVKASAGSGKTYRLVRDYLACCLWEGNPHDFKHILAITFTNKAAQEMKDRILEDVQEVSLGEGHMYHSLLEIVSVTEKELQRRAKEVSKAMMHQYEDFSVMTIDSFVNRLVRSFTKDLKWDEDFQIELDEGMMIEEAVSRLLSRVGKPGEEPITQLLEGFVRQQVEEESNVNFRAQLVAFGKQVTKESMQEALDALDPTVWTPDAIETFRKQQYIQLTNRRKVPREKAQAALQCIQDIGLSDGDFAYKDLPNWLRKVAAGKGRGAGIGVRLRGQLEEEVFWTSSASEDVIQSIQQAMPTVHDAIDAWKELYDGHQGERFKLQEHLQERVSLIGTLGLIRDALKEVELEKNVRLLSSLNQEISAIVRDNPAPFIYERIGNRYRNIFIDEFQDTSITQWHNLIQLFDHLIAFDEMGMVVGDVKQAIYRWRNGNYEQLEALPALIGHPGPVLQEASESLKRTSQQTKLIHNRRSGHQIVEWNNRWFRRIQDHLPEKLRPLYDDVEQEPTAKFGGRVHIASIEEKETAERTRMRNRWVLERIAHHTGGSISWENGHPTYAAPSDPGDHHALSDIAVLLRRNRDGALLAQYLLEAGITPWTSESLHLGRHPATRGVIALLHYLLDPKNPTHVLVFVQCFCAIHPVHSESEILEKHHEVEQYERSDGSVSYRAKLNQRALLSELIPTLNLWNQVTAPLTTQIGHCLDALGWGEQFPAYAEGMLELAHEVAQRGGSLNDFLEHWERTGHRKSIQVVGGRDAVQIMTPHKAKGLAFKVVIAPIHPEKIDHFKDEIPVMLDHQTYGLPVALLRHSDLKDTEYDGERLAEIDRTMLDALNVAYVTMTRAVDRLDVALEFEGTPQLGMEIKSLPQLLWAGWVEEFGEIIGADGTSDFGTMDRKSERVIESSGVSPSYPGLLLGQSFEQKVAVPRPHWSNPLSHEAFTPKEFGNAIHGLLAEITTIHDWPELKERVLLTNTWTESQLQEIIKVVESILQHPLMCRFFESESEEILAERSMRMDDGTIARPDRVVKRADGWHVIDFKTGKPRERHEHQVQQYCRGIESICKGESVHGWLIYTENSLLKEVHTLL